MPPGTGSSGNAGFRFIPLFVKDFDSGYGRMTRALKAVGRGVACMVLAAGVGLSGCATRPENVVATPADPTAFAALDCQQLAERRTDLAGQFNKISAGMNGLGFGKDAGLELGRVRGQYDAAVAVSRAKQCVAALPPPVVALRAPDAGCAITGGSDGFPIRRRLQTGGKGSWCGDQLVPPLDMIASPSAIPESAGAGYSKIVATELPLHGQVITLPGGSNQFSFVAYQADPGYTGADSFAVVGFYHGDATVLYRYGVFVGSR